jgi:hypothetical protein
MRTIVTSDGFDVPSSTSPMYFYVTSDSRFMQTVHR